MRSESYLTLISYKTAKTRKISLSEEGKKLVAELDEELGPDELTETQKAKAKWTQA